MSRDYIVHKPVELKNVKKKMQPTERELCSQYVVQPKYDGCALLIELRKVWATGEHEAFVWTRTGEQVTSCDHIVEALAAFPGAMPGVYFGEAWIPHLNDQAVISGHVRRDAPCEELQMVVFDYVTLDEWAAGVSDVGYEERIERLPEAFFRIAQEGNPIWPATCEGTLDDWGLTPDEAAKQYVALGGYDGIILRKPHGKWAVGSGTDGEVIKVKPLLSFALRVVGYEVGKGKGKHAGKIGTLLVSYNGRTQGAGTGLKDDERSIEEFETRWANKIVEVECMGFTNTGLLREPRMKGVRLDVLEPDA